MRLKILFLVVSTIMLIIILNISYPPTSQLESIYNASLNSFWINSKSLPQKCEYSDAVSIEDFVKTSVQQYDPKITKYIKDNGYLLPPISADIPYNLTKQTDPSAGQSKVVRTIFENKTEGFFIECGGLDGETRSNTLMLEKELGWKGLLVEADPSNYELLKQKNRKVWTAGCCLAVHPYPHQVVYSPKFNVGKIQAETNNQGPSNDNGKFIQIQCFPLFSLLSAIGVTNIDYFSLDVEGFELDVLKTIPFELVNIKVLSVEFSHGPGGIKALEEFMTTKNYRVVTKVTNAGWNLANDLIFVHNDFKMTATFPDLIRT